MPDASKNILEDYRTAVAANPESAEAHLNLGWGFYGQGQFAEAIRAFQETLRLDAESVDAYYGMALAQKAAGSKTDAVQAFESAAMLASRLPDSTRGQMLTRLIHGHINEIRKGTWDLDRELRHHEP